MGCIRVDRKWDFEELCNILLRNGYDLKVSASMYDDEGNEQEDEDIAFYIVEYEETKD